MCSSPQAQRDEERNKRPNKREEGDEKCVSAYLFVLLPAMTDLGRASGAVGLHFHPPRPSSLAASKIETTRAF